MKNKPLSAYKKKKLIESFCDELTASQAAHRLNLDRNTVNKYFKRIRECIAGYREYQKMQLLITMMRTPERKAEVISRQFPSSPFSENVIPVHIICISGQLLTDIEHDPGTTVPYALNVADYVHVHMNGEETYAADPGVENGELARIAEEFHSFASMRFKKYFGIRSDFAYLYMKEAEFVFNEKDSVKREKLLNKMSDKIFG